METWTDIEFTMPTDNDYNVMELIAKKFYDDEGHWPVEAYDSESRTIKIESVLATQDEAVEFATEMLEQIINRLAESASGETHKMIVGLSYIMHGHTDDGGYIENDYIIERKGNKLTMKESSFSHEDYEDDNERLAAYEDWIDSPNYGLELDLKNNCTEPCADEDPNDMIVEYLKSNNFPYDAAAIERLSAEDVYAIMDGTYGKSNEED